MKNAVYNFGPFIGCAVVGMGVAMSVGAAIPPRKTKSKKPN
jgi:hypothetical protein